MTLLLNLPHIALFKVSVENVPDRVLKRRNAAILRQITVDIHGVTIDTRHDYLVQLLRCIYQVNIYVNHRDLSFSSS